MSFVPSISIDKVIFNFYYLQKYQNYAIVKSAFILLVLKVLYKIHTIFIHEIPFQIFNYDEQPDLLHEFDKTFCLKYFEKFNTTLHDCV